MYKKLGNGYPNLHSNYASKIGGPYLYKNCEKINPSGRRVPHYPRYTEYPPPRK